MIFDAGAARYGGRVSTRTYSYSYNFFNVACPKLLYIDKPDYLRSFPPIFFWSQFVHSPLQGEVGLTPPILTKTMTPATGGQFWKGFLAAAKLWYIKTNPWATYWPYGPSAICSLYCRLLLWCTLHVKNYPASITTDCTTWWMNSKPLTTNNGIGDVLVVLVNLSSKSLQWNVVILILVWTPGFDKTYDHHIDYNSVFEALRCYYDWLWKRCHGEGRSMHGGDAFDLQWRVKQSHTGTCYDAWEQKHLAWWIVFFVPPAPCWDAWGSNVTGLCKWEPSKQTRSLYWLVTTCA